MGIAFNSDGNFWTQVFAEPQRSADEQCDVGPNLRLLFSFFVSVLVSVSPAVAHRTYLS